MEIIIGLSAGLIIAFIVYFLFLKKNDSLEVKDQIRSLFPEMIDSIVRVSREKLESEKNEIKTDLTNKKDQIEKMIKDVKEEIEKNNKKLDLTENNRIGSFKALEQSLSDYKKITQELSVSTESLKKVLSNNQLRGQFGEQVADNLLKMTGFVKGVDYEFNTQQEGSKTRPDFCIFLPDKARINVDSKFPYQNLQRMAETEDKEMKLKYMKLFETDVKEKIKQVGTRDYINPEDKTVDFVILFIPNEMIFSYIYEKMPEIWDNAMRNKVVMAGPFNFTAILRLVKQTYNNFQYQKNISQIIGHIQTFEKEFKNYNEEFEKIGIRIESLSKQYEEVSTTRTRQLMRTVDKIKLNSDLPDTNAKLIE